MSGYWFFWKPMIVLIGLNCSFDVADMMFGVCSFQVTIGHHGSSLC
jgi:hypothetical protein